MLGESKAHRQERIHLHPKEFPGGFVLVRSDNVSLAFCLTEDDTIHSYWQVELGAREKSETQICLEGSSD